MIRLLGTLSPAWTAAVAAAFSSHFSHLLMSTHGLVPGVSVHGPYDDRDPLHPDGTSIGSSDGLHSTILP